MRTTENLLNIKDLNLLDLAKKPIELCNKYQIPYIIINEVSEIKEGRKKKFIFNEKEYSRVEILAKDYYEKLGYKASWNEGFSFLLIKNSLASMILERIKEFFEPNYENDILTREDIDNRWNEAGSLLCNEIYKFTLAKYYPDILLKNNHQWIKPKYSVSKIIKDIDEINNKNYKELSIDFLRKTMLKRAEEEKKKYHRNPNAVKMIDITHN